MNKTVCVALVAALVLVGCGENKQSISVGGGTTGNVSQSQSGSGNSQSISIGNVDGSAKPAASGQKDQDRVVSSQTDPKTGNTQSVDAGGSGNISQNQSGRSNAQSIVIGGTAGGGTPSVTQSQTGADRTQSIVIDGKKVETKSN